MTNEELLEKGRALAIDDKTEWLIPDRIALVCVSGSSDEMIPNKYAVLFQDGVRVGVVLFMDPVDIHLMTFPEHRGKGHMSHFMRSGVIGIVEPDLKMASTNEWGSENFEATKHLISLAGLHCCYNDDDKWEFREKLRKEHEERLLAPCRCGSGESYECCCQTKDREEKQKKMQPCQECNAHKAYVTATRCWKCGEDY